uniref:Uncharacterized protein n=1 Tax=Steinernema glaseri TaxID=37863 RepID=A0A1I7ZLF1_9BILA
MPVYPAAAPYKAINHPHAADWKETNANKGSRSDRTAQRFLFLLSLTTKCPCSEVSKGALGVVLKSALAGASKKARSHLENARSRNLQK